MTTSISESRWRYHPLGLLATVVPVAAVAVQWVLFGLLGLFGIALVVGIAGEEGVLPGAQFTTVTDLVSRAIAGALLFLGAVLLLVWGVLAGLRGPLVARSLAATARSGVDPTEVPARGQRDRANDPSARTLTVVCGWLLGIGGLLYLGVIYVLLESADGTSLLAAGVATAVMVLLGVALWASLKVLPAWQERQMQVVREHWTVPHRVIADGQELTEESAAAARQSLPGSAVHRLGGLLMSLVAMAAGVGLLAFQLLFAIAYPDAERWSGGRLGDRADLDPAAERLVDLLVVGVGVSLVVALIALVLAILCEGAARGRRQAAIRAALAGSDEGAPPLALLRAVLDPTPGVLLRMTSAVLGAVAGLGFSFWFVDLVADSPDWDTYSAAPAALRALGTAGLLIMLGAGLALVLVIGIGAVMDRRDQELRDRIVQRWPARPLRKAAKDVQTTES